MGIEVEEEKEVEEKKVVRKRAKGKEKKKEEKKKIKEEEKKEEREEEEEEIEEEPLEEEREAKPAKENPPKEKRQEAWPKPAGQLAVDIYQTENELIIQSAIAGVKSEDLDISLDGDILTINGERKRPFEEDGDYFSQECYWGRFSREIILPVEVDPDKIEAVLRNGVLTIRMDKVQKEKRRKITVKE